MVKGRIRGTRFKKEGQRLPKRKTMVEENRRRNEGRLEKKN